jgi:hypothetical protein
MHHLRGCLAIGCVLLAGLVPVARGGPPKAVDAKELAARIDRHIAEGWKKAGIQPAALADDGEFVRRVYIDLAGRIPAVAEVRTFLKDTHPDKRAWLIEKLLDGPRYVTHFTRVYRDLLVPETNANFQSRFLRPGFEAWLREQLRANTPYDKMVKELLTIPVGNSNARGAIVAARRGNSTPLAFYQTKDLRPENLAAATSRLFLGAKVECAQCHDHPFATWKREQFWEFAAFFSGIRRTGPANFPRPGPEKADAHELTIPGTEKVVQARFLDGKAPEWKKDVSTRQTLAEWITSRDNPYFARATVNRTWAYFLGTGLIDPVDEMVGGGNEPSHPELLDELAGQFIANDFDLKYLIKAILMSRAYQLTSKRTHPTQDEARWFGRMHPRGMTAEQLWDSIAQATGYRDGNSDPRRVFLNNRSAEGRFVQRFGNSSDKPTEMQTSILQALMLMNGDVVGSATSLEKSETLAGILDAPFFDTRGRIEALYLAALGRKPTAKEQARLVKYVEQGGSDGEQGKPMTEAEKAKAYQRALSDVFWVLLNSGEFILNH